MKLLMAWNVWDNYSDLLLGSEIASMQNDELKVFNSLNIISQGGYKYPPNKDQSKYIDKHYDIEIDETNRFIELDSKFKGMLRVLRGIENAYQHALQIQSDYVLVTNADAWCLDLSKLKELLLDKRISNSAISARVGRVSGLDINWGDYVPFFDDHFIIINVAICKQNRVFEKNIYNFFEPNFGEYGGIHYALFAMMDEIIPEGLFYAYTDMSDCLNHFGELSGLSLLPWQFQPSLGFLHANCEQEFSMHSLRAKTLSHLNLDRFPNVGEYCTKYSSSKINFIFVKNLPAFKVSLKSKLTTHIFFSIYDLLRDLLMHLSYKKYNKLKYKIINKGQFQIQNYKRYRKVGSFLLTQRRP